MLKRARLATAGRRGAIADRLLKRPDPRLSARAINSRRRRQHGAAAIVPMLVIAAMSSCSTPDAGVLIPLKSGADVSRTKKVLAVTTRRAAEKSSPGFLFSGERDNRVHFLSLTISMPPQREPGTLPVADDHPDPKKDIALVSSEELSYSDFIAQAKAWPSADPVAKPRALVFTHGYSTRFDSSVVRFAQIVEDTGFQGVPILFSWPSRGLTAAYGYDKDSVNFSRDTMQQLLETLTHEPALGGVDMVAHSMGGWLTMETLRQIALSKGAKTLDRIGTVVLAAPDVDMDVFRTQVSQLGPLRSRIQIYVSQDDRALRISRRLFGGKIRAGENTDIAQFEELGITAHDISGVKGGIGKNHGKAFGDDATIAGIGRTLADGTRSSPLLNGLETIVLSVPRLDNALLSASAAAGHR